MPLYLLSLLWGHGGISMSSIVQQDPLGGLRQLVVGGDGAGGIGIDSGRISSDPCMMGIAGAWTVWEEWRQCRQEALADEGSWRWVREAPRHWEESTASAVVVELGSDEKDRVRPLAYAIRNALENLPVPWRVQVVVGSPEVEAAVMDKFPVEVEVGKIVVVSGEVMGEEEGKQEEGESKVSGVCE